MMLQAVSDQQPMNGATSVGKCSTPSGHAASSASRNSDCTTPRTRPGSDTSFVSTHTVHSSFCAS